MKILALVCGVLVALFGFLFWSYGSLKIRVSYASEQTLIFEEMRTRALSSDAVGAAGCLQYVVGYYPSGTKQNPGSALDQMVERERKHAIRDIVAYLHAKTSEELGENPEPWIQKYANR